MSRIVEGLDQKDLVRKSNHGTPTTEVSMLALQTSAQTATLVRERGHRARRGAQPALSVEQLHAVLDSHGSGTSLESASPLVFTHQPLCMITGVLRSPDIEHLAQQFSNLFVRIGLDDHDDKTVHLHLEIAKKPLKPCLT